MVLSWEEYYAQEEAIAEGYCNSVRAEHGLGISTGDENCEKEPCRFSCKWRRGE